MRDQIISNTQDQLNQEIETSKNQKESLKKLLNKDFAQNEFKIYFQG